MKIGSLIQYIDLDGAVLYGIVVEEIGYFDEYKSDAVRVAWIDDGSTTISTTIESVRTIMCSDDIYLQIISEG